MSVGVVNKQTGDRIPTAGMPEIDSVLSGSSTNPVQNRVVKAALDEKADTDLVASDFDATVSYTAGNYCIYEGKFYKFKNNHSGAWAASDVDEIKIAGELSTLKSGLINYQIQNDINLEVPDRKNLLPMTLNDIKSSNTTGTWNDNTYTANDGTFTVQTDDDGNVTGIIANGTFTSAVAFTLYSKSGGSYPFESTLYILNGCPQGGDVSTYKVDAIYSKNEINYVLAADYGASATANFSVISDADSVTVRIVVYAGTYSNLIFYPMIRLATENDGSFAPYIPSVESRLKALEAAMEQLTNS